MQLALDFFTGNKSFFFYTASSYSINSRLSKNCFSSSTIQRMLIMTQIYIESIRLFSKYHVFHTFSFTVHFVGYFIDLKLSQTIVVRVSRKKCKTLNISKLCISIFVPDLSFTRASRNRPFHGKLLLSILIKYSK